MPWDEIINHEQPLARFQKSVLNNRLASTYLFVGPDGVGKHRFALKLAQALLCENSSQPLVPCEQCTACQQVDAGSHPDLIRVAKPADRAFIPLELFIGKPDHRHQSGLCHEIGLKPFRGGRRIAIIDDADFLNNEGANSLLKTLEEPPPKSVLILVGTSEQKQLSTIISRSQIIRFTALSASQIETILGRLDLETSVPLGELAAAAQGSVSRAIQFADNDVFQFRQTFFERLATMEPGYGEFAKETVAFVESVSTDTAARRSRLLTVGDFAVDFFQAVMAQVTHATAGLVMDQVLATHSSQFIDRSNLDGQALAEAAAVCIDRTIDLQSDVHINAMTANIVLSWFSAITKAMRGQPIPA